MNKLKVFMLLLIISLVMVGCVTDKSNKLETDSSKDKGKKTGLMISAAVSLTDALEEIKSIYENEHHVTLTYILGSSGKLAQQIQQGAPVDAFISANQEWMDTLEDEGLIVPSTRADITGNKLVLITGKSSSIAYKTVEEISADDLTQIAIGNPESVPAGKYAEQLLTNIGKWDELESKLVYGSDVRQVLTYVETGNVDIGFVYESDALSSNSIQILATATEGSTDPVIYPGSVLKDTKHEKEATEFITFMASDQAQEILAKHGFRK